MSANGNGQPPFAARLLAGMSRRGLTLRGFCREAGLDPSFVSKVLAGKRSPPSEESVLRRVAEVLGLDAAELIVSAGRIPAEWEGLWKDSELFREVHVRASRLPRPAPVRPVVRPAAPALSSPSTPPRRAELAEELL